MIKMNVVIGKDQYTLSNLAKEQLKLVPNLGLIQKGLSHIFKPIEKEFPDHCIEVLWNDDEKKLDYSSDTLDPTVIGDTLKRHHGIEL
jgi:hypothetical protein